MDEHSEESFRSTGILGVPIELLFAIFALFVSVNLIYLDVIVFGQFTKSKELSSVTTSQSPPLVSDQSCPQSCLNKINELASGSPLSPTSPVGQKTPTPISISPNTIREFFIPFGSGSGSSTDWEDVPGLAASIDTSNYAKIKSVTFEATLRIPTGNQSMSVRLYNATDKHAVWFSDITLEGGATKLVISPIVTLDPGNKTYQVQMKTSLGYPAYIDQSRLKMITQ